MGDRTTPMKFGPEWLRNLSREPTSPGSQGAGGGAQSSMTPSRAANSNATAIVNSPNPPNTSKVLLAKLRYGREEILALYDKQTAEAPQQLKSVELLYHSRGKPPYALSNNFEDDTRDVRNNPSISIPTDRYGLGRGRGMSMGDGRGRGTSTSESRGKARGFVRQTSLGSDTFRTPSWHNGGQRTYPGAPEDDPNPSRGLWNNGNGMSQPGMRPGTEVAEWANKMAYRKNRQNNTNWRQQQNRDEGEEWRSSEGLRRGQEKWEREWPERSNQDKPWTTNRRQWGGDNNEDALPEWAVENSEACAGSFDSSGAFHGYSVDDSEIPKAQESSYPLARSRTAEEGSEEWWASEKAKKLSAKRFDATKVKFKMPNEENAVATPVSATNTGVSTNTVQTRNESKLDPLRFSINEEPTHDYGFELQDEAAALPVIRKQEQADDKAKDRTYQANTQPSAQQRIDMLRRPDERETSTEKKDYTSVMMAVNTNRLRQRHQNIGSPTNDIPKRRAVDIIRNAAKCRENEERMKKESLQMQQESKLVDDMLDMHLSVDMQKQLLISTTQAAGMVNPVTSTANKLTSAVTQIRMSNPNNQGMAMNQQNTKKPSSSGAQGTMMRPILGMSNSILNASLGLPIGPASNMSMPPPAITNPGMMPSSLQGLGGGNMQVPMQAMQAGLSSGMQVGGLQTGMQVPGMHGNSFQQGGGMSGNMLPNIQSGGLNNSNLQTGSGMPGSGMPGSGMPGSGMPGSGMPGSGMPGSGMPGSGMPGSGMPVSGMPGSGMPGSGMPGSGMPGSGMSGSGFQGNNSLFMQGAPNNMQNPNEMCNQQKMYPMHGHGLQQSQSQSSFNAASMYSNMMHPPPSGLLPNVALMDQWYYEDPKKIIQGPFTTKEMNSWYRAGFFSAELMVRRACEPALRPLATYGLMPFGPMQEMMMPPFTIHMRPPASHDNSMINAQQAGLGPDVESLWSQPSANDMMWIQQPRASHDDDNSRVNNLSMFFWDQPSSMSNSLLPEGIAKGMKTEDEILAQMRASQGDPAAQNLTFMSDVVNPEDAFTAGTNIAPNLEELQKLIGSDIHVSAQHRAPTAAADADSSRTFHAARHAAPEKISEQVDPLPEVSAKQQLPTKTIEVKPTKQPVKAEEKTCKNNEVPAAKPKTKKQKEKSTEVKDGDSETTEILQKRSLQKRSDEPSPSQNKKEDKANKKDLEKEKKEWLKDGFTIVKGAEKKDNKKKEKEEARAAEEEEKKRKEDEKRALSEVEKIRTPEPVTRRQQMEFGQVGQRQVSQTPVEPVPKKAPWSAQSAGRDGLALADIQRLEREKKLEQMKEQQLMMQAIAQQQAEAAQREQQELQAGQLGWAKKKQPNNSPPGQTLAEIQAEARKQAAAMSAAASAAAREEAQAAPAPVVNVAPWGSTNGGGFWDSPACAPTPSVCERSSEAPTLKTTEPKPKKKVTVVIPPKKNTTPSADFETWCTNVLSNWRDAANIDIPTFVAFLRDIESPYEVKDYVKCYLGDTKESNDFARQFLERRSRLLRVGMVTPSDDLCSPAVAINPRTNSGSDYTEVKNKGNKKTKKNKMLKIDARILGFSVTASEDRINVGDIDSV